MRFAALVGGGPRFIPDQVESETSSQLLAGSRNGPGRSPGAARVPDLRSQARGRHTSSRCHERLAMAPLKWTR